MDRHFDTYATGPGTLAGTYLRRFWQPVSLMNLKPGQAVPLKIMSEEYTLYRGESGDYHLIDGRCAHRRAMLSIGWVEGDTIRCRYHGWRYDASGQCVEQPAEGARNFCSRMKIRSYPLRAYKNVLFAYLGEGEPPRFLEFPQLEGDGLAQTFTYQRNSNYLSNLENNLDTVHINFTHHFRHSTEPFTVEGSIESWGATTISKAPHEAQPRIGHFVMPNVLLVRLALNEIVPGAGVNGTASLVIWRVPQDDESNLSFGCMRLEGDEKSLAEVERLALARKGTTPYPMDEVTQRILRGELTLEEAEAAMAPEHFSAKPHLEDSVIQESQGRIRPELENLAASDIGTALIRRLWREELGRVAQGLPTRQWELPTD